MKIKIILCVAILWVGSLLGAAEVVNVALNGTAYANYALYGGNDISRLIDGDTSTVFHGDTAIIPGFAYTIDLGKDYSISEIRIFPRQDGCCADRLTNFRVSIHKDLAGQMGAEVWGADQFTDGSNPGSKAGAMVKISLPGAQTGRWIEVRSLAALVPDYALQVTELQAFADVPPEQINRAAGTLVTANGPLYGPYTANMLVNGNRADLVHGSDVLNPGFHYDINLGTTITLSKIDIFARQDGCCGERLSNYRVSVYKDNNGSIGDKAWSVDLHTDGTNPGSGPGAKDTLAASLDASGKFEGQWIRIESLDNPVQPYSLQIGELEAYGVPQGGVKLLLTTEPKDTIAGIGQAAQFQAAVNVINGDPAQLKYQWQRDGVNILDATNATYRVTAVASSDVGKAFQCVVSYPGLASLTTASGKIVLNLAYGAAAYSNRPLWSGGGWNISMLVNGDRGGVFHGDVSIEPQFAYEVDLGAEVKLDKIDIYPRQDGCCAERFGNFRVSVHKDNNGKIGDQVWSADFYTDGTNPGSSAGTVVHVTAGLDAKDPFQGQWIRILSLDDPEPDYALQMTEMEVFGSFALTAPLLVIGDQPHDANSAPARSGTFNIAAKVLNGETSKIAYQWQKNGVTIAGATNATYITPPTVQADVGSKFRCVVSYPGIASVTSTEATLNFDYNYARGSKAYSNQDLWASDWNISQIVNGIFNDVIHGTAGPQPGFAYQIDMGITVTIDHIDVYARQDDCCNGRLSNFRVSVHKDNNGKIGDVVWSADLHTDGSNTGEQEGKKDILTAALDAAGKFEGQWIQILSLDNPVTDYALQMAEIAVIGNAIMPAVGPTISVVKANAEITLTWTAGSLESAAEITGPWSAESTAASPFKIQASQGKKFYRLKQ